MSIAPAKRFGIDNGRCFTLFDLNDSFVVDSDKFLSMGRATPFEDMSLRQKNQLFIREKRYEKDSTTKTCFWRTARNIRALHLETGKRSACEIVSIRRWRGYQEIVSDPAYANTAVVMTYPLIGNYGVADDDFESRAFVCRGSDSQRI